MHTIGNAGMPAGFVQLPGGVEARFTVSAAVDQPSYAAARAHVQGWMTEPARQAGDCHILPCTSVGLRYGDAPADCFAPRLMH